MRTSIGWNVGVPLAGGAAAALVSLLCVPVYLHFLGVEVYGLIGIWTTLEDLANLLDLGLTPTLTREMAVCASDPTRAGEARTIVRTLEAGYWTVGILIGAVLVMAAPALADHWFRNRGIPASTLQTVLTMIGLLIACRWPLSFYSGGLIGLDCQVLLGVVTTGLSWVRNLGAVVVLWWIAPSAVAFFAWQILVNTVQTVLVTVLLWRNLPSADQPARIRPRALKGIWRFAAGNSGIAVVALCLNSMDKLVASKMLSLETLGYYMLGWRLTGVLYLIFGAMTSALLPAFARLATTGEAGRLKRLYHQSCQATAVMAMPAATIFLLFGHDLLKIWTRSSLISANTYPIAVLLITGAALNGLGTGPYCLQLALGWTSITFYSNLALLCLAAPLLIIFTQHFGARGTASAWVLINAGYLLTEIPLTHWFLLRSELLRWYLEDNGLPLLACVAAGLLVYQLTPTHLPYTTGLVVKGFAGSAIFVAAAWFTPASRAWMKRWLSARWSIA